MMHCKLKTDPKRNGVLNYKVNKCGLERLATTLEPLN